MPEPISRQLSPEGFDDPDYQACYDLWLRTKGSRWAPAWQEWNWLELPVNLIPYFLVVDVRYDPLDFVYRFWGTANVTMHKVDMTGKSVDMIRSPLTRKHTTEQYMEVVENRKAIADIYTIQTVNHVVTHSQTTLRMPMSNDGRVVDQIVSFTDWRDELYDIGNEHTQTYERKSAS